METTMMSQVLLTSLMPHLTESKRFESSVSSMHARVHMYRHNVLYL